MTPAGNEGSERRASLRVLVATTVHVPQDARILHRQIAAMTAAGWQVTYIAPWQAADAVPAGVRAIAVPRAVGRRRLSAARAARHHLAALAPEHDVVLVHDPDLVPVALSVRSARPLVWDVHEDTAAALADRAWIPAAMRPALRGAVRALERLAERRCTLLLAERSYSGRFHAPHPVILNLPWAREAPAPRRGDDRAVYVGRLSRRRGLQEMIEVGRRLRGRIEVLLIGAVDRDDEPTLRDASVDGSVRWLGPMPNDLALAEVAGSVAGLSLLHDEPNYRGSMPTKVVEYLATGVPAVTTPLPEARDLITRYDAGLVVDFGDPAAAADAVRGLADDRERWERLSNAGFRAVAEHLSWDREVPRFLDAIEDAARG